MYTWRPPEPTISVLLLLLSVRDGGPVSGATRHMFHTWRVA